MWLGRIEHVEDWPVTYKFIERTKKESAVGIAQLELLYESIDQKLHVFAPLYGDDEVHASDIDTMRERWPAIQADIEALKAKNCAFKRITSAINKYKEKVTTLVNEARSKIRLLSDPRKKTRHLHMVSKLHHHGLQIIITERRTEARKMVKKVEAMAIYMADCWQIIKPDPAPSSRKRNIPEKNIAGGGAAAHVYPDDSDDEDTNAACACGNDSPETGSASNSIWDAIAKEMLEKELNSLPKEMQEKMARLDEIRDLIQGKEARIQHIRLEIGALVHEQAAIEDSVWSSDPFESGILDELAIPGRHCPAYSSHLNRGSSSSSSGSFHTYTKK